MSDSREIPGDDWFTFVTLELLTLANSWEIAITSLGRVLRVFCRIGKADQMVADSVHVLR